MIERPILFSAPMVRAIIAGTKTQTRRVLSAGNSIVNGYGSRASKAEWARVQLSDGSVFVDAGPSPTGNPGPYLHAPFPADDEPTIRCRVYPTFQPGARLWVKETSGEIDAHGGKVLVYRADDPPEVPERWCPSIHMRRSWCRVVLEVVAVRAQRLQDISAEDAIAEGIGAAEAPRLSFGLLWDSINGERDGCSWAANPWVWAITFRRVMQ